MTLFHRGFAKYLDSGKFSDLTLVCEGEFYKVHKIVLVYSSEFFSRLLRSEFKESQQPQITLGFPDPDKVFPLVLKFMYTGELSELNLINAIPILAFADHYLIRNLQQLCSDFVKKHINRNNASDLMKKALPLQQQDVIEICSNVMSKNFSKISTDHNELPLWIFQKILHHKYLAVKDEYELYKTICTYVSHNEDEISESQRNELFEAIRFRWMTIEQLMECEKNPLVPRYLILETIMSRLRKYECPDREEQDNSLRNQKRITCLTFEYKYDFDDRGILYYIATNGDSEKWQNPHTTGRVKVTASSIEVGNAWELLNNTPSELWTKDVPASWFTIDFGQNRSVMPTHYSLRHGGNYRADSLRTWDLQGSVDGKHWVVLRRHTQDTSLTDKFATHTWPVTLEKPQEFRFFRILQTGRNSSNHNFLVLSGVEFYGDLYEWKND